MDVVKPRPLKEVGGAVVDAGEHGHPRKDVTALLGKAPNTSRPHSVKKEPHSVNPPIPQIACKGQCV